MKPYCPARPLDLRSPGGAADPGRPATERRRFRRPPVQGPHLIQLERVKRPTDSTDRMSTTANGSTSDYLEQLRPRCPLRR